MDPLSHRMREQPPPSEIKKHQLSKEKEVNVSQEAFEQIMASFKENENEMEDPELLSQIANKLAENRRPIPLDSPFADTDMVIFKDDYKGTIPSNGIRESDLKFITQIYNDITKGLSKIKIDNTEPNFNTEILLCIKTLLTREIGRKEAPFFI